MVDSPRRDGMLEVAEAIGGLRATVEALGRRQGEMHLEHIARHTEVIERITDAQAQVHEVKHIQNNDRVIAAALSVKMDVHGRQLTDHHQYSVDGMNELKRQIEKNHDAADARELVLISRIDELSAWRWWVKGGIAALSAGISLVLFVWGHDLWMLTQRLFQGK